MFLVDRCSCSIHVKFPQESSPELLDASLITVDEQLDHKGYFKPVVHLNFKKPAKL